MFTVQSLCRVVIALFTFLTVTTAWGAAPAGEKKFGDYSNSLTGADKKNIQFIINTLANNSMIKLMVLKKDLEQAGQRVSNVHPLKFLCHVYSDKTLNANIKKISAIPWKRFSSDMAVSLNHAYKDGQIKREHFEDFAKNVKVDIKTLEPFYKSRDWKGMMEFFRNRN